MPTVAFIRYIPKHQRETANAAFSVNFESFGRMNDGCHTTVFMPKATLVIL